MIPQSLEDQRKGIIGLLIWLTLFFLALLLIAASKNQWDAVAGLAGATIALVPAIMAYDTIYQTRINKLPQLDIIIDATSRYKLFQLGIINNGGSTAYNVSLDWLDKDLVSDKILPTPYNIFGQPVSFAKEPRYNVIRTLAKGQTHLTVVDAYHQFFERYPSEAFFLAKLSYSETLTGENKMEVIVPVSFDEFRTTLDYSHETSKTNYKLQQLPDKFDQIKKSLDNIAHSLNHEPKN